MSKFLSMLGIRTRAIAPPYQSQWVDRLKIFNSAIDGIDYIEAGYPYSTSNLQITLQSTNMQTIGGQTMQTIDGQVMETI